MISTMSPNRFLSVTPSDIDEEEIFLSQLGSNLFLLHRVSLVLSPACPEFGDPNPSAPQLFSYPSVPTDLLVVDLWERPGESALFISSLPFFSHLPTLPPSAYRDANTKTSTINIVAAISSKLVVTGRPLQSPFDWKQVGCTSS